MLDIALYTHTNTRTLERSRKDKYPKKHHKYMFNCNHNSTPLQSKENSSNNASQNVRVYRMTSRNVAETDKENIHIYACNVKTESELEMALSSINF